jgi:hypothetical protein
MTGAAMPGNSVRIRGGIGSISRKASRVAEHLNIRDIRLIETSTELKSFSSAGPFQWNLKASPSVHYEQGDQFFVLTVGYHVTIEKSEEPNAEDSDKRSEKVDVEDADEKPEEVADISFQFGMLCELEQESLSSQINREELEEYADAVAIIVFSPYVREYLHDVTMRMGLPPLVMDILPSFGEEVLEHTGANGNSKNARSR